MSVAKETSLNAIKKNWVFYLLGLLIILTMKYYYSRVGLNDLRWILAPSSWWAGILTGLPFEWVPESGYVNHSVRFIIAASCSGFQFMIIVTATLIYSFLHQVQSMKGRFLWMAISLMIAYPFTVLVNGLRIVMSIYLPPLLQDIIAGWGWLTADRLHTVIGTVNFFFALLVIYHTVGTILEKRDNNRSRQPDVIALGTSDSSHSSFFASCLKCLSPIFWYFFIMLGIPFLNGAHLINPQSFMEYVVLASVVCTGIIFLYCQLRLFLKAGSRLKAVPEKRNLPMI